jgi:uncharacterized protein (DUF39 family)
MVKDSEKYIGMYVTVEDFNSEIVLTSSKNAYDAYHAAINLGYNDPVLIYIPKEFEK